jgi:HD superfamily phosphodiesterase
MNMEIRSRQYLSNLKRVHSYAREYMLANTNKPYHNWGHAKDVARAAMRLARHEGIDEEGRYLLLTAAMLHDVHHCTLDHESYCSKMSYELLPSMGYTDSHAEKVAQLIWATNLNAASLDTLDNIIKDADLDNLGREDFMEKGDLLRQERQVDEGSAWYMQSDANWYQHQYSFIKNFRYNTDAANALRGEQLQKNIDLVRRLANEV